MREPFKIGDIPDVLIGGKHKYLGELKKKLARANEKEIIKTLTQLREVFEGEKDLSLSKSQIQVIEMHQKNSCACIYGKNQGIQKCIDLCK